jgi:DedD protein
MFKISTGGPGQAATSPPTSIDALRRRARYRLIGAAVLVLIGVVGLPILFDAQPRPIPVDIAIEIPAKDNSPALAAPQAPVPAPVVAPAPAAPVTPTPPAASAERPAAEEVIATKPAQTPPPAPSPVPAPAPVKPEAKPDAKPAAKPVPPASTDAAAPALRMVVQVGAFADAAKAQEVRVKLERAGLKTYTHVANTPQGKRIRVRLGPFETRAEADKAAAKVKALGLPAALLTL